MNSSSLGRWLVAVAVGLVSVTPTAAAGVDATQAAAVDDAAIERARTGVTAFISENADSIATGITAACPLMTRDEFGWFMGEQGLSPNMDGWAIDLFRYDGVGSGARGLACGIDIAAHVAGVDAGSPHGARLEAIVVPDGATLRDLLSVVEGGRVIGPGVAEIGGEVGGTCYPGQVAVCVLMWFRSGLAVTTVLAGPPASVTESRTMALMSSMIPTMIQDLGRYAIDFAPPPPTAPTTAAPTTTPALALDTEAARATLAEFAAAHPVGTSGPEDPAGVTCPTITSTVMGDAMSAAGLAPGLDPFLVSVRGSAIAPGLVTVSCGGNPVEALGQATLGVVPTYTPSLTVYDITGSATIDHVLAERPDLVQLQAGMPSIGGDLYGGPCDLASGSGTFCVRVWHRDGLVVMFEVSGNARPDFDAAATQVITALVPTVVGNLATHATWPASATGHD